MGCYGRVLPFVSPEELLIHRTGATNVLRAVLTTFFIVLIALFFSHENTVSRTFLPGATMVLAVLGMVSTRLVPEDHSNPIGNI